MSKKNQIKKDDVETKPIPTAVTAHKQPKTIKSTKPINTALTFSKQKNIKVNKTSKTIKK